MRHGAQYAYRTGCRCQPCQAWKAADVAAYRRNRRRRETAEAAERRRSDDDVR